MSRGSASKVGRIRLFLIVLVIIASALYAVPRTILPVHSASGGVVCLAANGTASCPGTPPLINSTVTLPPPQLRVSVAIDHSAGLYGFDVIILADASILKPAGVDYTNTVLLGIPQILADCVGTVTVAGTCSPQDTANTLEFSATSALSKPNTPTPTTGVLFTAIYNVTGSARNIPIAFQTGCSNTSFDSACVTITNVVNPTTPNTETVQPAKFTNLAYFDLQDTEGVGALSLDQGSWTLIHLNVTSIDGFAGNVTIAQSVTPTGPTVTLSPTSVKVNSATPQSYATVNITAAASLTPLTYTLTFTATTPTFPSYPANTLSVNVTVVSVIPDFTISTSLDTLQLNVTSSNSTLITVTSHDKFSGFVNLTVSPPPSILKYSLSANRLNITSNGSGSATLSVNSTTAGAYELNITGSYTGTFGTLHHSQIIMVTVTDFTVGVPVATLPISQGGSKVQSLIFGSQFSIHATISLGKPFVAQTNSSGTFGPSSGISVTCTPTKFLLAGSGPNIPIQPAPTCSVVGTQIGLYTVSVLASAGSLSHAVIFNVQVSGPDFTIVAQTPVVTVDIGKSANTVLVITGQLGLNDIVKLNPKFAGIPSSPPSQSLNVTAVTVSSAKATANVLVTFTSPTNGTTGVYTLTVAATTTQLSHQVIVTVVVTTTVSPHNLVIFSVSASPTSATVGSKVTITILVQNLGSATENSTVVALAGDISVGSKNFTNLLPGQNVTVTITWNTSGFGTGPYSIGGQILGVPGQTNYQNNIFRLSQPVTLNAANTGILQSPYLEPGIIATLIVLMGIMAFLILQARRKPQTLPPSQ